MKTSESIKEISAAMAKSQIKLENTIADGLGNFNNRFTKLSTGLDMIRKVYGENGIAFTQMTRFDGEIIMLDTRMTHSSGEWIEGEYPVCKFPVTSQQLGSAMSYARRYAIFAAAGIASSDDTDDDDGTEANAVQTPAPKRKNKPETVELMSVADSARERSTLIASLTLCKTEKAMSEWRDASENLRARMHQDDRKALNDEWMKQINAINGKAA